MFIRYFTCLSASMARLCVRLVIRSDTFFHGNYHEIFSTVILSLLLIQEGQLSASEERMFTILVNHLED